MRKLLIFLGALITLAACSDDNLQEPGVPQSQIMARKTRNGSLTGEDGGFTLLGGHGNKEEGGGGGSPIGVNSFLWRATLDTLSFMPLASADPFGGVIITDWYEDPKTPGERFKVNALILDKTLRADGLKITVFKQLADKKGSWRDQQADDKLERSLEDTILTRARQMKIAALGNRPS
jgi:hypothetical protein